MVVLLFLVPRLALRFSVRIVDVLLLMPLPRLTRWWVSLALLPVDDSTLLLLWLSLVVAVDVLLLKVRVDSLLVLVPLP